MIPILTTILILLVASAFFSSAETAYFSISPLRSAQLGQAGLVRWLLSSRDRLLGTILSGNHIVNFTATALWTTLLIMASKRWGWNETETLSIGAALMVVTLLILGEITPKIVAVRLPMKIARLYAPVLIFFWWLFFPLTWALSSLSRLIFRGRPRERPFPTDEEVKTMIEMAVRYGILRPQEEQIMENLVDLGERTVSEVMTPRVGMSALPVNTSRYKALAYVKRTHKSRYPIYEDTTDKIVGVLYTKDLIVAPKRTSIRRLLREPYFVPETKVLSELLEELRRSDQHIAIVVDEFGGIAGLATLEDILEAIFGEIVDEYDTGVPYKRLGRGRYLVDGDIDLAKLNEFFDDAFAEAEDEFDRLSELITHELGHIPKRGEKMSYKGIDLTMRSVRRLRIEKVLLEQKRTK
ncbi:MAG: HlyC/CorC family transporter [Candidatus Stahlbacteria bacterium]|nr:MAG: HlyC/CorC family transporter [Candidatus Stahlbacteria bacterium]